MDLLRASVQQAAEAKPKPENPQLRPIPFMLYIADGDNTPGSYNVFTADMPTIKATQQVIKRFPEVDCTPPAADGAEPAEQGTIMQLAVVLQRCPHWMPNMANKWAPAGEKGSSSC